MAQLLVRNLEDTVKEKLRLRAHAHRRSMEEEARVILKEAVTSPLNEELPEYGLGSRISSLFKNSGLTDAEIDSFEHHGEEIRPVTFE